MKYVKSLFGKEITKFKLSRDNITLKKDTKLFKEKVILASNAKIQPYCYFYIIVYIIII